MPRSHRIPVFLFTLATFLVALAAGLSAIYLIEQARLSERQRTASELDAQFARQIEQRLTHALSATHALAATIRQGEGRLRDFDGQALEMMPLYPGVSALQLAPGGVIGQSFPLAGNEKAIGHNLLADTARNKEARLAIDTRRLTLAGPFTLRQGGEAVIGRLPVFLDDPAGGNRFWGFSIALIRLHDFLPSLNLAELERLGYGYELWRVHPDSGERHIFARSRQTLADTPVTTAFDVPNGRWHLSLAPAHGWHDAARLVGEALVALLLAGLLALAAYQYLRHRRVLQESEESYRSLFDSVQEAVYVLSREGVFLAVNQGASRMYGHDPEWFVGKTPESVSAPGRNDMAAVSVLMARAFAGAPQSFEFWGMRDDGAEFPKEVHLARGSWFGKPVLFALARDISALKSHERQLEHIAHHDALTGLPNRVLLADRMYQGIAQTRRANCLMAVGYLDLDGFKPVNDSFGHEVGDRVLIEIARRMQQALRAGDTVARLGGDEFAFLLLGVKTVEECENTLKRLLAAIAQSSDMDGHRIALSASVGVTLFPFDDADPDTLLRHADQAMYLAKQGGKNRYQFHALDGGPQGRGSHLRLAVSR